MGGGADGVGGTKGGRVAAELSVRAFIDDYVGQSDALPPRKTVAKALESINHWIHVQGQKDENLRGMAAVFTGIVIKGHRLHCFHVGDTRLYRLRDGAISQLTRDHKPEGAEQSNLITRAIGMEEAVRIDGGYAVSPDGAARFLVMRQPVGPCLLITPWNFPMAMGTRKRRQRQEPLWYRSDLPSAPGHPFYNRLNEILDKAGSTRFANNCARPSTTRTLAVHHWHQASTSAP